MRSWLKPWLVLPLMLGVLSAAHVWLSHLRYELSLETQTLAAEKQTELKEISKLRIELASLTRPERLRNLARTKLDMAPPNPMQVIHQ
jgi:cell division protein FtsL